MLESYADLEIRILEEQKEGYPVEVTFSGEQEFPRGYLDPGFLPWVPGASSAEDGERLFGWLFADERLKTAWAEVRGQNPLRRVRLRIDASAPELHALPWELLRDASPGVAPQTLAADVDTPFSRYLAGQWRPGRPILSRPIKILVAIANPENLAQFKLTELDVALERQILEEAISGGQTTPGGGPPAAPEAGQIELTFLEPPTTLSALEAELNKGYHVLHIVAHGAYSEQSGRAVLYLADRENQVALAGDTDFAEMLSRQEASLRLVFLASCQSATRSFADAFRGLAPRLIAAGVPAVLAMQDRVPVETARWFAGVFYRQLVRHGYVDVAGNEARSALLTEGLSGASVPVLFMRLRSGMLFGQRGQILGERAESFWTVLLENIADGLCTPFLGPEVTYGLLPSPSEVAQVLADNHNYPFEDREHLPQVAQFVGTLDNARLRRGIIQMLAAGFKRRMGLQPSSQDRRLSLSQVIEAAGWAQMAQEVFESEIHHQLADLGLPLYLTTNFDNFMTLALRARGREPRRETIAWDQPLSTQASKPHYDLEPSATPENPVVLHLFGTDDDLLSMVLTQDDHLDYLTRVSRDFEYLLPTSVQEALASTTLLFLGYRLEDLDLKVIMRGLLPHLDLERWGMLHVAVQVEAAEVDEAKNREVIRYFQRYFGDSRIDVYWGNVRQFVSDLHARWEEYNDGSS